MSPYIRGLERENIVFAAKLLKSDRRVMSILARKTVGRSPVATKQYCSISS